MYKKIMQFQIKYDEDMLRGLSALFSHEGIASEGLLRAYMNDILRRYCQKLTNAGVKNSEAKRDGK